MKKLFLIGLLIASIVGCKSGPSIETAPSHKIAKTFIGYSTPWDFAKQDPTAMAKALRENGLNFTIIEIDFKRDAAFVANWVKPFRERGITVEIILVNWNTKAVTVHPDSDFYRLVDELKSKVGSDHVIFMPITEPGNRNNGSKERAKAGAWMRYGYQNLPAAKAICIKSSWWGQGFAPQAQYKEYHLCSETISHKGKNDISTTDCTPLINISPDRVYKLTKQAIKANTNFCYYHADFKQPVKFDIEKIRAIGRAIEESA